MPARDIRHLRTDNPRVMVVDGSKLVRKLISDVLKRDLAGVEVVACADLAEAEAALAEAPVDLVTTALALPDGDGLNLARRVRDTAGQRYVPVIVVSGDAQQHLEARSFTDDVTDYFDKANGYQALAAFIHGYVHPEPIPGARVLYVEDSITVAVATRRMLQAHGLTVIHVTRADAALKHLREHLAAADAEGPPQAPGDIGADLLLTDVTLDGEMSGLDLLRAVRNDLGFGKRRLPVLVMTGDGSLDRQSNLLREGANDLVLKPIEERMLITKTLFQLRLAKL
jgi:CheY-like chemotaxis protein